MTRIMTRTDSFLRYLATAGIFLILITPAIVYTPFFFPFIAGKGFFFRIVIEIVFASYLILALRNPEYRPRKNSLTIAVTAFTIIVLIADLMGLNINKSLWSNFERMEGFVMIAHLFMFFIASSSLLVDRIWKYWLNTSIAVSFFVMFYGFLQLFGIVKIHQSSIRIESTLGNSAYFAVYMLLNLGFAAYLLVKKETHKFLRIFYAIFILLYTVMIYYSGTRGTALGLVTGVIVGGILFLLKAKEQKKERIIVGIFLALIISSAGIFYLAKDSDFVKTSPVLSRFANISLTDKSQARAFIWPMAIQGFKENPILGWGQENFNLVFNKNYDSDMWMHEQWFDRAHNVFLDWLVAAGLLGFLSYISLYALAMRSIWKNDFSIKEKSVLVALLVSYAVHNIFVFDNISSYILFFGFLAFLNSKEKKQTLLPKFTINKDVGELLVYPGIILILIWSLYYVNTKPISANLKLIQAMQKQEEGIGKNISLYSELLKYTPIVGQEAREQIIINSENIIRQAAGQPQVQTAFFELAKKAIEKQTSYSPNDARGYLFGGGFLARLGQFKEAEPFLKRAHELSPTKQSPLFDLATMEFGKGNIKAGLEYAKKAYDFAPEYPDAISIYSSLLAYSGDYKTSLEVSLKEPSVIVDNSRLVNVLIEKKQYKNIISLYEAFILKNPNDSKIIQIKGSLAATYLANGERNKSIAYIQQMAKDYPEFKPQSEQLIKDINAGKMIE